MKIEEMSNEELVRSLMSFSWVAGSNDAEDNGNRYKPELLTRLDRGEKAVKAMAALEAEVKQLRKCMTRDEKLQIAEAKAFNLEAEVKRLKEENENLRCCGNCIKYKYLTTIGCYNKTMFPCDSCANWQSDKRYKGRAGRIA